VSTEFRAGIGLLWVGAVMAMTGGFLRLAISVYPRSRPPSDRLGSMVRASTTSLRRWVLPLVLIGCVNAAVGIGVMIAS
jgi:hypothetical protein